MPDLFQINIQQVALGADYEIPGFGVGIGGGVFQGLVFIVERRALSDERRA